MTTEATRCAKPQSNREMVHSVSINMNGCLLVKDQRAFWKKVERYIHKKMK